MKWLIFSASVAKKMNAEQIDEYCREKFPISEGWKIAETRCEASIYSKDFIICATYEREY